MMLFILLAASSAQATASGTVVQMVTIKQDGTQSGTNDPVRHPPVLKVVVNKDGTTQDVKVIDFE